MLNKSPSIYRMSGLLGLLNGGSQTRGKDGKWYPARPEGYPSLRSRLRAAWFAFTGKGDVLIWPAGQ